MKKNIFDEEEKKISESYDRDEWRTVRNSKGEIKKLRAYARNTLLKDKRVNIRIDYRNSH